MNEEQRELANSSDLNNIKTLLASGLNIDATDSYGNTMLMFAAQSGRNDIVQHLIDKDADVAKKDKFHQTALIRAAMNGHMATINLLMENGASIGDWPPDIMHKMALYLDVTKRPETSERLLSMARWLLENGANADYRDEDGDSPLIQCARHSLYELAGLLIKFGATIDLVYCGMDIYTHAANQGDTKMVELLKKAKEERAS